MGGPQGPCKLANKTVLGISLLRLPFPREPAVFKVKCNLPELRPPDAQNAVKIVAFIFPVICDKGNLRADCFLAEVYLRNLYLPALKTSTPVGNVFGPERLQPGGVGHSTLEQHQVRADP